MKNLIAELTFRRSIPVFMLTFMVQSALCAEPGRGTDKRFDVKNIPKTLLEDADAVVRDSDHKFVVENIGKAREYVREVITVLNAQGRDYGREVIYYGKFKRVKKIKGLIRNPDGSVYRKLKKSEIKDYAAISGISLYEESRVKYFELFHDRYPYTVEYEYEVELSGLLNWGNWTPQVGKQPVEKAQLEASVPIDIKFRFDNRNLDIKPDVKRDGDRHVYTWKVANIPKLNYEPYSPSWQERVPSVALAPNKFRMGKTEGNMKSWKSFGKWNYQLWAGRDILPPELKSKVHELTAGVTDPVQKAKILYKYLQSNTRYISIQLGIGGWQPFEAQYVFEKGYGDCKALTNYMKSMLTEVGLPTYPVLVNSGSNVPDVKENFPRNQFNHVFLFVPTKKDTVWLECTNQTIPFNHIGASNEGRNVLMVTPEGGKLIRTPTSRFDQNRQIRHADVKIGANGDGFATVRTTYSGNQQDRVRGALAQSSALDREKWLRKSIDTPRFQLASSDFSNVDAKEETISLSMTLDLPRYASATGKRLFLNPKLIERRKSVPDAVVDRKQPVWLTYAWEDIDSLTFELPTGFVVENMPENVDLTTDFGAIKATYSQPESNKLVYKRVLRSTKRRLPPEQYEEYRKFLSTVVKADRAQVVLVKK